MHLKKKKMFLTEFSIKHLILIQLNAGLLFQQELSWRSRNASLQKSDLLGLTQPAGTTPRPPLSDRKGRVSLCLCVCVCVCVCAWVDGAIALRDPYLDRRARVVSPEVKAMAGESETDRWARESRERRRARARRRAQRAGEVSAHVAPQRAPIPLLLIQWSGSRTLAGRGGRSKS